MDEILTLPSSMAQQGKGKHFKMPKKRASESGFVDDTDTSSARKSFFNSYMPQLEAYVRENSENNNWDDPTIDLDLDLDLVPVRSSSPLHQQRRSSTKPIQSTSQVARQSEPEDCQLSVRADSSFNELKCILQEISKHTPWGEKLLEILIRGLKKDYDSAKGFNIIPILEKGDLPINWIPIIKMNNLNTPYIEFLFKVDQSDEPPDAQLTNFTGDHLVLGYEVMKHIKERLKNTSGAAIGARGVGSASSRSSCSSRSTTTTATASNQVARRQSAPPPPQKRLSNRDLNNESLMNDSKRILPSRSCKFNRTYRTQ